MSPFPDLIFSPFVAGLTLAVLLQPVTVPAQDSDSADLDLSGAWNLVIAHPDRGNRSGRLSLLDRDGSLSGRFEWNDGRALEVSGTWRERVVELRVEGSSNASFHLKGSVAEGGSKIGGSYLERGVWMAVLISPPSESPSGSRADRRRSETADRSDDSGVRDRTTRRDLEDDPERATSSLIDNLVESARGRRSDSGFASVAVESTARIAGRQAADAATGIGSDAVAEGIGDAAEGAVGAGLREALPLDSASDVTPLEAASHALADAAVNVAAGEAYREVSEAASDVVEDEVADRVGRAAGGILGETLGSAVEGGLIGGLFGRDDEPEQNDEPAIGSLSGRWRLAVIESRGEQVLTHIGVLHFSERDDEVEATIQWTGSTPSFLGDSDLVGEREGYRLSVRVGESGPLLRGAVGTKARRMGGYVLSDGFLGLWQATR